MTSIENLKRRRDAAERQFVRARVNYERLEFADEVEADDEDVHSAREVFVKTKGELEVAEVTLRLAHTPRAKALNQKHGKGKNNGEQSTIT